MIGLPSDTISCIFPTVNPNSPTEAVHTYSPASSSWRFVSFRVPSARIRDLPTGRSPPDFDHFIWGFMLPVAWQRTELSFPLYIRRTSGGLTGTWITSSFVLERSDPTVFFAVHSYSPSSCLVTLRSFNILSSITAWGDKLPPTFDHLTFGVGEPVTWHFGRVMVVFSLAYVGPLSRSMRGSPGVELKEIIYSKTYRQHSYSTHHNHPTPPPPPPPPLLCLPSIPSSPPLPPPPSCRSSERFRSVIVIRTRGSV